MNGSARTPAHLWIVGALATLWNGFGATDYTMTQLRAEAWTAHMTPAQAAWIESASPLVHASWAFGVWGGLAGALLLLARSRHAALAFALSLAGLAVNTALQLTSATPSPHLDTTGALILHLAIWAAAIALLLYALRMRRRGVLR